MTKTCEVCSKKYEPKRKDSKTCSHRCLNTWHQRRYRAKAKKGSRTRRKPVRKAEAVPKPLRAATGKELIVTPLLDALLGMGWKLE